MAIFRCKMCGGDLEIAEGQSVCTCEFCGTEQTLPRLDSDRKANLYDRANHFRRNNDFDKAMGIYEQILNEDNTDAEAYWSLVLCRYGIEYVEDPSTHKRIPTINRAQYTSIYADENYKAALEHAAVAQKNVYEQEAKTIDEIQRGILAISEKEEPFDVFICYKETDETGRRTPDSVLANDLYHQLTQEGFKVFFARITLEDKLGQEYEPYIFAALNSAKVMVVLGTKPDYFKAVWVKNEWARFLALIRGGAKKMLIPAYKDMDPYDLPEEFSHLQAQDMTKLGFMQDLIRGIKKIIGADQPQTVTKETVVVQQDSNMTNINALIDRGYMALEDKLWEQASEYFDKALDHNAKSGDAYLGLVFASNKSSSCSEFVDSRISQYEKDTIKMLTACNIDTRINSVCREYKIDKYLDDSTIRKMFKYDLTYESRTESREKDYNNENAYLESDVSIGRALQFLVAEKKVEFENAIENIRDILRKRISISRDEDIANKNRIPDEYSDFVEKKIEEVKNRSKIACEKRENEYQNALEQQEKANTVEEYYKAIAEYEKIGDYKEAAKKIDECKDIINRINEKNIRKSNTKKLIIATLCALSAIGMLALYSYVIKPGQIKSDSEGRMQTAKTCVQDSKYEDAQRYLKDVEWSMFSVEYRQDYYASIAQVAYDQMKSNKLDKDEIKILIKWLEAAGSKWSAYYRVAKATEMLQDTCGITEVSAVLNNESDFEDERKLIESINEIKKKKGTYKCYGYWWDIVLNGDGTIEGAFSGLEYGIRMRYFGKISMEGAWDGVLDEIRYPYYEDEDYFIVRDQNKEKHEFRR